VEQHELSFMSSGSSKAITWPYPTCHSVAVALHKGHGSENKHCVLKYLVQASNVQSDSHLWFLWGLMDFKTKLRNIVNGGIVAMRMQLNSNFALLALVFFQILCTFCWSQSDTYKNNVKFWHIFCLLEVKFSPYLHFFLVTTMETYLILHLQHSVLENSKKHWHHCATFKVCCIKIGISLDSKGFWRWCITHRITGFLDFFHHLVF
jgi:hypothetical protein